MSRYLVVVIEIRCAGVLFDSDGVLIDSHHAVEAAWRQLAVEFSLPTDLLASELAGVRAIDLLTGHLSGEALGDAVGRLDDLEVAVAKDAVELRGAGDLLAALNLPWAVVTSASRRLAEARWRAAGLPQPPASVTAEDVENGKPNPDPYLNAAALLGIAPEECVAFEDSATGGTAAHRSGAVVVAVGLQAWTFTPAARIPDLTAVEVLAGANHAVLVLHP